MAKEKKMELVGKYEGDATYRYGEYVVYISSKNDGVIRKVLAIDITGSTNRYLPAVYYYAHSGFTIQTKSYGEVSMEQMDKIIEGINMAKNVISAITQELL